MAEESRIIRLEGREEERKIVLGKAITDQERIGRYQRIREGYTHSLSITINDFNIILILLYLLILEYSTFAPGALVLFLTYSESLSEVADYMNSSNLFYQ